MFTKTKLFHYKWKWNCFTKFLSFYFEISDYFQQVLSFQECIFKFYLLQLYLKNCPLSLQLSFKLSLHQVISNMYTVSNISNIFRITMNSIDHYLFIKIYCSFEENGHVLTAMSCERGDIILSFFNRYSATPRPTFGHYQGNSLTHPMLSLGFNNFDPKVTGSLVTKLGP